MTTEEHLLRKEEVRVTFGVTIEYSNKERPMGILPVKITKEKHQRLRSLDSFQTSHLETLDISANKKESWLPL